MRPTFGAIQGIVRSAKAKAKPAAPPTPSRGKGASEPARLRSLEVGQKSGGRLWSVFWIGRDLDLEGTRETGTPRKPPIAINEREAEMGDPCQSQLVLPVRVCVGTVFELGSKENQPESDFSQGKVRAEPLKAGRCPSTVASRL